MTDVSEAVAVIGSWLDAWTARYDAGHGDGIPFKHAAEPEPGLPQITIGHLRTLVGRVAELQTERIRVEDLLAVIGGRALAAEKDFDDPVAFALWGIHGVLCDALGIEHHDREAEGDE